MVSPVYTTIVFTPNAFPRSLPGKVSTRIAVAFAEMNEAPKPWMALERRSCVPLLAYAEEAEPAVKASVPKMKRGFRPFRSPSLPALTKGAHMARR